MPGLEGRDHPMSAEVARSPQLSASVYGFMPGFTDVRRCLPVFTGVRNRLRFAIGGLISG